MMVYEMLYRPVPQVLMNDQQYATTSNRRPYERVRLLIPDIPLWKIVDAVMR